MKLNAAAKAEIAEAVRILREDGVHIHKTYAAFQKSQEVKPPEEGGEDPANPPAEPPGEGDPPPPKEPKPPTKKKHPWWGEIE